MTKEQSVKQLMTVPGIGRSIANDLWNIGIRSIDDLKGKDPGVLYSLSNKFAGTVQDRCLLYCFRCAVWYSQTKPEDREPEKLKWWNWKNKSEVSSSWHPLEQTHRG